MGAASQGARALERAVRVHGSAATYRAPDGTTTAFTAGVANSQDRLTGGASKVRRIIALASELPAPEEGGGVLDAAGREWRIEEVTDLSGVGWSMRVSLPRVIA